MDFFVNCKEEEISKKGYTKMIKLLKSRGEREYKCDKGIYWGIEK